MSCVENFKNMRYVYDVEKLFLNKVSCIFFL